jgi:antirestriction protein ArdC
MDSISAIREDIVAQIVEALQADEAPWRKMWKNGLPVRVTGEDYRGLNTLILMSVSAARGYLSNQWMTFQQAKALGGQVRKGSKSVIVVFYKQRIVESENPATGEDEEKRFSLLKHYRVFNVDQIDNLPESFYANPSPVEADAAYANAVAFIAAQPVQLMQGRSPYYDPLQDCIHMPPLSAFETQGSYYATCIHELVHASGAASRLNRECASNYATDLAARAEEEMIAEFGAMMACAALGVQGEHIENHASYIQGWLSRLQSDPKWIFKAASQAQAAVDWLLANQSADQQLAA